MTIGVIGAMQMEVDDLKAQMTDTQTEAYSGVEFVEGKIGDQYVVAAKCGIGKVFAAICAEAMILKYDVDMIVNIGVAGTLTKDLNVLDVAVATNVLQHDMDTSPIGDPKGLLSGINMILLPADTKMVELMCSCLADRNIHYKKGNIATGDQFIATKEQKERNAARMAEAERLRKARFAACFDEKKAAAYPEAEEIFHRAGENFEEVYTFLSKDENPNRKKLLFSLELKDAKDLKASVLEDHLDCEQGDLPEEIFRKDLLCPRIFLEELTPYRSMIRGFFEEETKRSFVEQPERILDYLKKNITFHAEEEYDTIMATPVGVLTMKQGSPLAQKILFVAICRSLNVAARLNPVTLEPEYYRDGAFHSVETEAAVLKDETESAVLTLNAEDGSAWKYYQTWTIGKWNGTVFETLNYEDIAFDGKTLDLTLEPGCYRLITSMRMPNGDQHAAYRVFELKAGEAKEIYLETVKKELDELLEHIELPKIRLEDLDGTDCTLNDLTKDGPILLAFLGTGEEPTEHVLNELIEIAERWNAKDAAMAAVLRTKADLENATFRKARAAIRNMSLYLDPADDAPVIAEKMGIDAEKLPLLILVLPGNIGGRAYAGYNFGSGGLMLRLMEEAAKAEEK